MSPYSFLDLIQERYPRPGCLKAYRALCLTMRGRTAEVDWAAFSPSDWELFGDMASRDAAAGLIYHAWQGGNAQKGRRWC